MPWAGHLAGLSGTVATTAATGFGVVGLGVALLHKWIDFGIPYTPSAQDETIQEGIRKMYGDGVTQESLTPAQAQRVAERYSPPFGVAVMISDKMDSVAQRIFPWNR